MAGTFLTYRDIGGGGSLRSSGTGVSPDSTRTISETNLLILTVFGFGAPAEIIAFDQVDDFYVDARLQQQTDPGYLEPTGSTNAHSFAKFFYLSNSFRARIKARGYFNTTPYNWPALRPAGIADDGSTIPAVEGALCWDITQAYDWTIRTLGRFSKGAPHVRLSTNLTQYALQIGDFVKIDIDRFINHGRGLNETVSNAVWEIVGKEVQITEDTPAIIWDLVWVRDDTTIVPYVPEIVYNAKLAREDSSLELLTNNLGEIITQNDEGAALTVSGADPYPLE